MCYNRRIYTNSWLTCRCTIIIILAQFCFILYLQHILHKTRATTNAELNFPPPNEPIDVVYTWVNGSDPKFLQQLHNYVPETETSEEVNGARRYTDTYELLYSLRSLEMNIPWIRHVFIVTNGQVPNWLNLNYSKVSIITHDQIFLNSKDLPTFSSPAIETNLHRIPGLSKRFLYLNDDWLIGSPVEYSTFYTPTDGQIFHWAYLIQSCSHLCPWSKVNNGKCDVSCYVPECQMDGNDCPEKPELFEYMRRFVKVSQSPYDLSIQTTQRLLNIRFGFKDRYVMPHMPLLLDKDILSEAWDDFYLELSNTSSHKYRNEADLQFEFFYVFYTLEKKIIIDLPQVLIDSDLNYDGYLNDDEVQLMMVKHYKLNPSINNTLEFYGVLKQCVYDTTQTVAYNEVITLYEEPEEPKSFVGQIGEISINQLGSCKVLNKFLELTLRRRNKYKAMLMAKVPSSNFYFFGSLKSNYEEVVNMLNGLRRFPRKFICLNDDLTHTPLKASINQNIYKELLLFYEGMFPKPSKFELVGKVNPEGKYINEFEVINTERSNILNNELNTNWKDKTRPENYKIFKELVNNYLIVSVVVFGISFVMFMFFCRHRRRLNKKLITNGCKA